MGGTAGSRSETTVTPSRPAAAANSGNRVPASRCERSQVERSREADSRGCPGGASRSEAKELARLREVEYPPTRNWSPAVEARSTISASHWASTGTDRGAGLPTRTSTTGSLKSTSSALTRATQRPSSPAPTPRAMIARAARILATGALAPGIDGKSLDLRRRVGRGNLPSRHWRTTGLPWRSLRQQGADSAQYGPIGRSGRVSSQSICDESLDSIRIQKQLGLERYTFRSCPGCQPGHHSKRSRGARPPRDRQLTRAAADERTD